MNLVCDCRSLSTTTDEHAMTRGNWGYSYWVIAAFSLLAIGCESGGVGDPCIPEVEYDLYFNNFSERDVFAETRSFQCETRLCLVNHFAGRVSCPYGQTQEDLDAPDPDLGRLCKVPGTSGEAPPIEGADPPQKVSADVIQVPVSAQLVSRRDTRAVYCSCRCKNADGKTDDGANYCDCPSGYSCEKLIPNPDLGRPELAGYYCIKENTQYQPGSTDKCERDEADPSQSTCGNNGNNP